jgi:uncharacterized protein YfaS (alpha-2-macroglobulin family)
MIFGLGYFLHQTHTNDLSSQITSPEVLTPSDEVQPIAPLTIQFVDDNHSSQSVAPLANCDKEITKTIRIAPDMPGKWHWIGCQQLVFNPQKAWRADQKYTVHYDNSLFAQGVHVKRSQDQFVTAKFTATIKTLKLYNDPQTGKLSVVGTVDFNYPINLAELNANVYIIEQQVKDQQLNLDAPRIPITITLGKKNQELYLHTDSLALANQPQYLVLVIAKDLLTTAGQVQLAQTTTQPILLPNIDSMLRVTNVNSTIVKNAQGFPEQVLVVNFTTAVAATEISRAIKAVLLPIYKPGRNADGEQEAYDWSSINRVAPEIIAASTPVTLEVIPTAHQYETTHSYRYRVPSGRYLDVEIPHGITSLGGYHLAKNYVALVQASEYPKQIEFLHQGSLLALSSEHKLSVLVRGVPAVKFSVAQVLPEELNHLITQTEGDFHQPHFINSSFNQDDLSVIHQTIRYFNIDIPGQLQYTALDLDKYFSHKVKPLGLFLINAQAWDPKENHTTDPKTTRLILITDMGLIVKNNADDSHDVYVQSITHGTPVVGAQVQVLGRNGLPIATALTDTQGHTHFFSLQSFMNAQEPVVYVVRKDKDISFIPFAVRDRALALSRFNVEGIADYDNTDLSAFLFSDRGIYRPGELVHFGVMVKHAYGLNVAAGIPVEAILTDPNGNAIFKPRIKLNSSGYFTLDYQTQPTSPTGEYSLTLSLVHKKERHFLGDTSITVMDFLPDTMKINVDFSVKEHRGWVSPKELSADVALKNLFGFPAVQRKVTGKLVLVPQGFAFKEYSDYQFYDGLANQKIPDQKRSMETVTQDLSEQQTNQQGIAHFNFNLQNFGNSTYQLTFYTQGFEADSGRSVSTQISTLVSPMWYLLGYHATDKLDFIKKGTQQHINIIAINNQLQKIVANAVTVQLLQQNSVATLAKNEDGTYHYESVLQEIPLSKMQLTIPATGLDYRLPTDKIGSYVLVFVSSNGITLNRIPFTVVGNGELTNIRKNSVLSVRVDKQNYQPGDKLTLQITAPYVGTGLITLERDKVYAAQWFKTSRTNTIQTIFIPKNFVGSYYVNVTFARAWDSPEIFINPLSYSVTPFTVGRAEHQVKVQLMVPEVVKPGTILPIHYSSDKPSKIIVYAVSEGILQVAKYRTPDPLQFYFQQRALQVTTTQTLDQILPKFISQRELSAVGGDGMAAMMLNYLNPFARQNEQPVIFWSGILEAGPTTKKVNYQIPDNFAGQIRLMAVAVGDNAVGATTVDTFVRGDFILSPTVPTVVAPSDQFDVSVNVTNNVQHSQQLPVVVTLTTSAGLKVVNAQPVTLTLNEKQADTAHFKVTALPQLGNASFTFRASAQQKSLQTRTTVSIRPIAPRETTLVSGSSREKQKTLRLTREMYEDFSQQTMSVANSPLIFMQGLARYLADYPYGCTEQVTSRAIADLAAGTLLNRELIAQHLATTLDILRQRQAGNGAFAYWPKVFGKADSDSPDTQFATVYALHFLTIAKIQGYNIPADMLTTGLDYLALLLAQPVNDMPTARLQAYAIYVLTLNQVVTTNYLSNLQVYLQQHAAKEWHQDIVASLMAATYHLLQDEKTANDLMGNYQWQGKSKANALYIGGAYFNAAAVDGLYLDLLAEQFAEKFVRLGAQPLIDLVNSLNNTGPDTLSSAYAILALSAYKSSSLTNGNVTITAVYADQKSQTFAAATGYELIPVALTVKNLRLDNPHGTDYFYQFYQAGYDRTLPTTVINQGLELQRDYTDPQGKVLGNTVKQGTVLTVTLKLRSVDQENSAHIAVVDLLPGGFEIVPKSIKGDYQFVEVR